MRADSQVVGERVAALHEVMCRLRADDGCPWDRAQSLRTLRAFLLEETYELLEAMESGAVDHLREELGDLLFQIVFQARICEERGEFDLGEVADGIRLKLLHRHPHVFGEGPRHENAEQVREAWELIKRKEKRRRGPLDGVPVELPALARSVRMGEKAAQYGFDWPDTAGVRDKVREELAEYDEAIASGDMAHAEAELGDLLFALCQHARHLGLMPEDALRGTIGRFTQRFEEVERRAIAHGHDLRSLDIEALESLWQEAKGVVG